MNLGSPTFSEPDAETVHKRWRCYTFRTVAVLLQLGGRAAQGSGVTREERPPGWLAEQRSMRGNRSPQLTVLPPAGGG